MNGQLVIVVGASGAGKDSLLHWLTQQLQAERGAHTPIRIATRWITRAAHASERHHSVDAARFAAMLAADEFALHWSANDAQYGVGREIDAWLALGDTVVVNGSRAHLAQVAADYPQAQAVLVRVSAAVLAQRLHARGRESAAQVEARLARHAALDTPLAFDPARVKVIDNDGTLDEAGRALLDYLREFTRAPRRDRSQTAPDRQQMPLR